MLDNGSMDEEMGPYGLIKTAAIEDAVNNSRPMVDELHKFIQATVREYEPECPQIRLKHVESTQS